MFITVRRARGCRRKKDLSVLGYLNWTRYPFESRDFFSFNRSPIHKIHINQNFPFSRSTDWFLLMCLLFSPAIIYFYPPHRKLSMKTFHVLHNYSTPIHLNSFIRIIHSELSTMRLIRVVFQFGNKAELTFFFSKNGSFSIFLVTGFEKLIKYPDFSSTVFTYWNPEVFESIKTLKGG